MKAYCKHFKVLVSITLLFFSFQSIAQNPEDDCAAAFGNVFMVDCFSSSPLGAVGSNSGNPDPEASCLGGTDVTWYAFEFDAAVVSFGFVDVDTDVALYTGPDCSSLTEIVCQGSMLVPNVPGEIFLVAAVDGQEWEINIPQVPNNEDCTSAEPFSGTLTSQSNVCASVPTGGCSGDNSVWYEVDVLSGGTTLEIEITSNGIANAMVSIFDGCGGTQVDDMSCSDVVTAECLTAGFYYVEVSSDNADAGDFDITETQTMTGPMEDVCTGAVDVGQLDCGNTISENGDPTSCVDAIASGCMSGVIGTWYTFTTAASLPTFTIVTSDDFELFEGSSCGSLASLGDCGIAGVAQVADASLIYYVLVDGDGAFDIETPMTPSNEESNSATNANGGLFGESNLCASASTGNCSGDNSVWYEIDIATDGSQLDVTITPSGALPIVSPAVSIYDDTGAQVDVANSCSDVAMAVCLVAGTYSIEVVSAAGDAGEFDIAETITTPPAEDNCDGAIP